MKIERKIKLSGFSGFGFDMTMNPVQNNKQQ